MDNREKYNYKKAEADLEDMGVHSADDVYDYRSEKSFREYMEEHDLDPDKYLREDD